MKNTNKMWKKISGFNGAYFVSQNGEVYSRITNKILKQRKLRSGYCCIGLSKNGEVKSYYIHRLVASAFLTNPENLPCVNHKDENKSNNTVTNLEWCTQSYNNNYGTRNARVIKALGSRKGEKNGNHKLNEEEVAFIKCNYIPWNDVFGCKPLAKKFGVSPCTISRIVNEHGWHK